MGVGPRQQEGLSKRGETAGRRTSPWQTAIRKNSAIHPATVCRWYNSYRNSHLQPMDKSTKKQMREQALAVTKTVGRGTVATVSADDGAPSAAMMFLAADDNFNLYFMTSASTRKASNLAKDNRVAIAIDDIRTICLQIQGRAELLSGQEKTDAFAQIARSTAKHRDIWPPLSRISHSSDYIAFRVKPESIRMVHLNPEAISIHEPAIVELM